MKTVTVSLSSKCIKNCKFCYQDRNIIDNKYLVFDSLNSVLKNQKVEFICLEFNGYNIGCIEIIRKIIHKNKQNSTLTLTTIPELINRTFCSFVKTNEVYNIAISFNSEVNLEDWLKSVHIAKDYFNTVACNFLLENSLVVPQDILKNCDQLNLLSLKPTGELSVDHLKQMKLLISLYNKIVPTTVDNCLGYQLDLIDSCKKGVETLHIMSNGEIKDCSFGNLCFLNKEN